jgi:mediator of RNA polymerase II transcription subunit 31
LTTYQQRLVEQLQYFSAHDSTSTMAESVKEGVGADEERIKNRKRFELELEFVQALANPFYLHSLAQQGILYQPTFINYLKYLLYWKEKDYARFIL